MHQYAIWACAPAIALALLLCTRLRLAPPPHAAERVSSLDGLRGLLALGVFIHHSVVHYGFARTGLFWAPDSHFYAQLGDGSVKMFFMITGFLFVGKLLRARRAGITLDWQRLYASRLTRIFPLYWSAIAAMFVVIGVLTHFELRQDPGLLALHAVNWLELVVSTFPDLNGVVNTRYILAGVVWTLVVEWMFYMALPAIALCMGLRVSRRVLAISLLPALWLVVMLVFRTAWTIVVVAPFFGGALAAWIDARERSWKAWLQGPPAACAIVALLVLDVLLFPDGRNLFSLLLLAMAFIPIACGNTLFGLFSAKAVRNLGEMSYSIYLLHGLLLYVAFVLVIGPARTATLSPLQHWGVVTLLAPLLVLLCAFSFQRIERPGMAMAGRLAAWLEGLRAQRLCSASTSPAAARSNGPGR
ncbi:acyltransferase [Pelomonas sp. KK5]|uniref:acyltransferase family protein n=1 Tax=Pelomonas sp. KK5 TaxID=1855730 RepID=UPI0009F87F7C|nr:acyltransferase [Pelomonas sp. KK5]